MTRQGQQTKNEPIRRMVEQHLRYREQAVLDTPTGAHLDEDRLAAFVEGCLSQAESAPVVSHLVACSPCRHVTVELLRLELELEDAPAAAATTAQPSEPGRIRRLLESLAARVLPQSDEDAVFAYHAPAEDVPQSSEKPASALPTDESQPTTPPTSSPVSPCNKDK